MRLYLIRKTNVLTFEKLPEGRKAIDCRWIYKIKYNVDGLRDRYTARLVAKCYLQQEGIDYEETFSSMAR